MTGPEAVPPRPAASAGGAPLAGRISGTRWGGKIRAIETWFDDDPESLAGYDVWISHQRSQPLSAGGWHYRYTLFVDLLQSEQALLGGMRRGTAREIRNAQTRDGFVCTFNEAPTAEDLVAFAAFYDAYPLHPDQPPMDRVRLGEFHQAGFLKFAEVRDPDGAVLVRHGVLGHDRSGIAQPVYQVSAYHQAADQAQANAIGRANRLLYYREFLFYKERGYRIYDLNGWYTGTEDAKRLRINLFKEGFRGKVCCGFDCEEAVSLRGRVYVVLKTLKRWLFQPELAREFRRLRTKPKKLPDYQET